MSTGFSVLCDDANCVRVVLRNDSGLPLRPRMAFTDVFEPGSRAKALGLVETVRSKHAAFAWELYCSAPRGTLLVCANAALQGDDVLVVAAETREEANAAFAQQMMGSGAKPDRMEGSPGETRVLYEQLSELNNRLVTAQRELAKSNAELKQLLADRAKIAAMAGHDLRSPLQVITYGVTALTEMLPMRPDSPERQLLAMISRSGDKMIALVNDLLSAYSRDIGQLELSMQVVDIAKLARDNAEANRALALQKGITVSFNSAGRVPPVLGDPVRLEQVFDNLLHNAIKYSPQASTIKVDVVAEGEQVTVAVENEGSLTRDELDRILAGESEASEATAQSEGGFGLGFSIMKTIVQKHRGTIQGDSDGGRGVRFSIHLPACDRSAAAA